MFRLGRFPSRDFGVGAFLALRPESSFSPFVLFYLFLRTLNQVWRLLSIRGHILSSALSRQG